MCRDIQTLLNFEPLASEDEVGAAALQYFRKIGGFTMPSEANGAAFAHRAVAAASSRLLAHLVTHAPPKDRDAEAERRAATRLATA